MVTDKTFCDNDRKKRRREIISVLSEFPNGLTAKEISVLMCIKGFIPASERNFVAPRLSEMKKEKIIEFIGKKRCKYTGKTVSVYALKH